MRLLPVCCSSIIDKGVKEEKPETKFLNLVSGCKSTLNSVFLFSDTVFFNYVFYFIL